MTRAEKCLSLLLHGLLTVGGIWLLVKFILPWTAPFILAFLFAALMEPAVKKLNGRGFKRPAASAILTVFLLLLCLGLIFFFISKCASAAGNFIKNSPEFMEAIGNGLEGLERRASKPKSAAPEALEQYFKVGARAILDTIYGLPALASQHLLDFLAKAAQKSPSILLFVISFGLGSYFISASFPETTAFLLMQLSDSQREKLRGIHQELRTGIGGIIKAQGILMLMSFLELLLFFYLLKLENPIAPAFFTALIDALPVFGTGIVLVPWAVYSFIIGDYSRALGFIICWGCVNLVRSCAQAKLTGDEIGLNPILSLAAVYIGWKVWRVWGMLLFPLIFSMIQQLEEKGIIKIWKRA